MNDAREHAWYCDVDTEGNVIDVPMFEFDKQLQLAAVSLVPILLAAKPLTEVVRNWR